MLLWALNLIFDWFWFFRFAACENGRVRTLSTLLDLGAKVGLDQSFRRAAVCGHVDCLKVLWDHVEVVDGMVDGRDGLVGVARDLVEGRSGGNGSGGELDDEVVKYLKSI
jgi:hypothetical protein